MSQDSRGATGARAATSASESGGAGPRVYRGVGASRAAIGALHAAVTYGGAVVVAWVLGLDVRSWRGWLAVFAPLLALLALRLWAARRVSVELTEGHVRYEGASTRSDWEVALKRVRAAYLDPALPGAPLVLMLDDGDERACLELGPGPARALSEELRARGIAPLATRDSDAQA